MEEQKAKEIIVSEDVKKMLVKNDFALRLMYFENEIKAIILYDNGNPISYTSASRLLCINKGYYEDFCDGLVSETEMNGLVAGCINKATGVPDSQIFFKVLAEDLDAVIASGAQTLKLKKKLGN